MLPIINKRSINKQKLNSDTITHIQNSKATSVKRNEHKLENKNGEEKKTYSKMPN